MNPGLGKRWRVCAENRWKGEGPPDLGISPLSVRLLQNRGICSPDEARHFLFPALSDLPEPFSMKGMDRAVSRIARAIRKGEKVALYGDYDVDGTTATALLLLFLKETGLPVEFFIPDRVKEGYGLNLAALKNIRASGASLLITADCGISSAEEIRWAGENGLEVIVTDHHEVPEKLPPAAAILNPKQRDCPYPFKGLAGVGVAFNLVIGVRSLLRKEGFFGKGAGPNLKQYLDLVALGTVSDVVPLRDANRILVKYGLQELGRSARPGIAALKEVAGLGEGPVDTVGVNFRLAPRINAAGRLADAGEVVRLLTTDDPAEARRIAARLNELNSLRQRIEEKTLTEARRMIAARPEKMNSVVLASLDWHPGVVGIVASRLAEEFHRPAILIAMRGEMGKGSGRSIACLSLYEGLKACGDWMEGFGGHEQAAGLVIRADRIAGFSRAFDDFVGERLSGQDLAPRLDLDAVASLEDLEDPFLDDLEALAPFGPGNPEPTVGLDPMEVVTSRVVGKDHLRLRVKQGRLCRDAIGFGMASRHPLSGCGMKMAIVPQVSFFQGKRSLQLRIVDLHGKDEIPEPNSSMT